MPGHTPAASAGPRGHPLLSLRVALTPPGRWCPRLCTRQASFSAHERDLERRRIHGACLVGAPQAHLLEGEQLQGCEGWCPGSMQQELCTQDKEGQAQGQPFLSPEWLSPRFRPTSEPLLSAQELKLSPWLARGASLHPRLQLTSSCGSWVSSQVAGRGYQ